MKGRIVERKWIQPRFDERQCFHMSSLTLGYDGTLLAIWCGGRIQWNADPMDSDGTIWMSRLEKGAEEWSAPEGIGTDIQFCCHNPIFYKNRKGNIFIMYAKFLDTGMNLYNWCNGRDKLWVRKSIDGGLTWLPARETNIPLMGHPSNNGVLLPGGDIVVALSITGWSEKYFGAVRILRSIDDGETWEIGPVLCAEDGTKIREPAMALRPDGSIQMFTRSCPPELSWGTEEFKGKVFSYKSRSSDGGRNWSTPVASTITNNESMIDLISWVDGSLLMAYDRTTNLDWRERSPLWIAFSKDEGETWTDLVEIAPGPGNKCQPAMCIGEDGLLHVIYMWRNMAVEHVAVEIYR